MTKDELIQRYRVYAMQLVDLGMQGGVACGCRTQEEMDDPEGEWLCKLHHDVKGEDCKLCDLIHCLAELEEVRPVG